MEGPTKTGFSGFVESVRKTIGLTKPPKALEKSSVESSPANASTNEKSIKSSLGEKFLKLLRMKPTEIESNDFKRRGSLVGESYYPVPDLKGKTQTFDEYAKKQFDDTFGSSNLNILKKNALREVFIEAAREVYTTNAKRRANE